MSKVINYIDFFFETCKKKGGEIAVVDKKGKISFKELNRKSFIFAAEIKRFNYLNRVIPVIQEKNILNVISNIGILISGNAYMNIDYSLPEKKIFSILKNINSRIIITDKKNEVKLKKLNKKIKILNIEKLNFNRNINKDILLENLSNIIDTDPFCVINTSGSTGIPKSTVLNHRNFIDFIYRSEEIFKFSGNEIMGSLSPSAFDIFSFEICLMMFAGSKLVLIPDEFKPFPVDIIKFIKKNKVSFIFWVPTIMVMIANLDLLTKFKLDKIKLIWFAGEVFPTDKFNYWKKKLSNNVLFVNLYGPIEITLDCSYFIINRKIKNNEPIPIGKKYKNTDLIILKNNKRVKQNEIGEIYVRGSSVALGYYGNLEETNRRFVQNPLNKFYREIVYKTGDLAKINDKNELVFIGRKDNQIKHLGYRLELDEIEHVLINKLKLVDNGCALYDFKKKEIYFFYEGNKIIDSIIINKIKKNLAKQAIPNKWVKLNKMPLNLNGKIDRLKLTKSLK